MLSISRIASRDPVWIAIIVSFLMSLIVVVGDDLINDDGILYLDVATKFLQGDWASAIATYNWAFYPFLIAGFSKISFLEVETAAHVLNAILYGILTYVFIRCIEELGGNRRVAIIAAILLFTNVSVNEYRDIITRDPGYWAFFFTTLLFFLKYINTEKNKYIAGFVISVIVATLFRIEGIVFALALPFILVLRHSEHRIRLLSNPVLISVCLAGLLIALLSMDLAYIQKEFSPFLGRLIDPLIYFHGTAGKILSGAEAKVDLLVQHVIGYYNKQIGVEIYISILFTIMLMKIYKVTGFVAVLFSVWSGISNIQRKRITDFKVIISFITINLIVLAIFLLNQGFLSSRYVVTFGLLVTLIAAFGLEAFFYSSSPQAFGMNATWHKRSKIFIVVLLVYAFFDGVISTGVSKSYIRESGEWIKNNVSASERLLASETTLYYYSGRSIEKEDMSKLRADIFNNKIINFDSLKLNNYDYLAIKIKDKQKKLRNTVVSVMGQEPIHRSANERGDSVLVFKVNK